MTSQDNVSKTRLCVVTSVDDEQGGGRIQVRFHPEDIDILNDKDLPWCFPLLPKTLHCIPKKGETVIVMAPEAPKANRFYIGPIISQDYNLYKSTNSYQSKVFLGTGNMAAPLPRPENDTENDGTLPHKEDIAIRGRRNADLILKDSEVRMRCGFQRFPNGLAANSLKYNKADLAYIMMRYRKAKDEKGRDYSSSVNIVADRINLLSHDSSDSFVLGDSKDLITDKQMEEILNKAHVLPYGDLLIEFLKEFVRIFCNHVHSHYNNPPSLNDTDAITLKGVNFNQFLSKSIRIN